MSHVADIEERFFFGKFRVRTYRVTSKKDMKFDPSAPWHYQCQVIFHRNERARSS